MNGGAGRSRDGTIALTAGLDVVAVHARCSLVVVESGTGLFLAVVVDVFCLEVSLCRTKHSPSSDRNLPR